MDNNIDNNEVCNHFQVPDLSHRAKLLTGNSWPAPKTHKNYLQKSNAVRYKLCSKADINDFKDSLLVLSVFLCVRVPHTTYMSFWF